MISKLAMFAIAGVLVCGLFWIIGTDSDFKRLQHRAELNQKIRNACVPVGNQKVIVGWHDGRLVCSVYTPSGVKTEVDVERRQVAKIQDFNE